MSTRETYLGHPRFRAQDTANEGLFFSGIERGKSVLPQTTLRSDPVHYSGPLVWGASCLAGYFRTHLPKVPKTGTTQRFSR